MLSKYDYEKLADQISEDYIKAKTPLNQGIKVIAIKMELNPEQIKRLTESTNIKTYNKMFDSLDDKTFKFDLGDSKKVISDVYSDGNEVEIKDMPPVQYEAEMNPKAPKKEFDILGDTDEVEVSKNTANSEDSSSDHFIDALKVPKKDYSYAETNVKEDKKDSEIVEDTETKADDIEEKKIRKTAALGQIDAILKELNNREMLAAEMVRDETSKVASLFRSSTKDVQFVEFVKNAGAMYGDHKLLGDALNLVRETSGVSTSIAARPGLNKVASVTDKGMKPLRGLLDALAMYEKIALAKEVLLNNECK
jgi:hypothetical protein